MRRKTSRNQAAQQSLFLALNERETDLKTSVLPYFEHRFFAHKFSMTSAYNSSSTILFTLSGITEITRFKEQLALFTQWFSDVALVTPQNFSVTTNASKPKRVGQKSKLYEISLKLEKSLSGRFLLRWRHFLQNCFKGLTKDSSESYRMSPFSVSTSMRYFGLNQLPLAVSGVASTNPLLKLTMKMFIFPKTNSEVPSKVLPRKLHLTSRTRLKCLLSQFKIITK